MCVAGLLRLRYVCAWYTHRCMNLYLYVSHMFETFVGFSLYTLRACQNAVRFQKLSSLMLLTNNVFNFQGLEPPLHTCPALLNLSARLDFPLCLLIMLDACHLLLVIIGGFRFKASTTCAGPFRPCFSLRNFLNIVQHATLLNLNRIGHRLFSYFLFFFFCTIPKLSRAFSLT